MKCGLSLTSALDVALQLPVGILNYDTPSSFEADACQDFPIFCKDSIVQLSRPICLQNLSQNFLTFGLDSRYDITILRAVTQSIATSLKAYFVEIEAAARMRARMTMTLSGAWDLLSSINHLRGRFYLDVLIIRLYNKPCLPGKPYPATYFALHLSGNQIFISSKMID